LDPIPPIPGFDPTATGGGSESQDGILYCVTGSNGIVRIDVASRSATITGVVTPTTAYGYGHDGSWYGNGGGGGTEARTLYRIQPELVDGPTGPMAVIESIGIGTRRIEDVASSPDGTTLYAVGEGYLFTIDRKTGVQSDVGPLGFTALGIAFNDEGDLLTADGLDLMEIDPASGATTFLFTMANPTVPHDLAGIPTLPVPVPAITLPGMIAGWVMLAGVGLFHLRRRAA